VSAKPWVVVAVMAMMCLMPYQSVDLTSLSEDSERSESSGNSHEILFMGNSYVASNSLKNLVDGVMNAASQPANVSALTSGGMRLSQHWNNVASAGHQWNTTLNNGNWDYVILQDQSQVPGFPRSQNEWIASKDGAVELAEVIEGNGGETVLMMTWGRRDGDSNNAWRFPDFSTMQDELESGYLDYRDNISANGGNAWVAPVGLAFEHIHDKIVAEGGTPTNSGNTFYNLYTGDGSHPSLSGSYLAAVVLYATITGNNPVGLSHSTTLSNGLVLELQQAAAATVFNETSHLDYPWQANAISQPPPKFLGWENVITGISVRNDYGNAIVSDQFGNVFVSGTFGQQIILGNCSAIADSTGGYRSSFVAKINNNGSCQWISTISKHSKHINSVNNGIALDSDGSIYVTGGTSSGPGDVMFNSTNSSKLMNIGGGFGSTYLAKLNSLGEWDWVYSHGSYYDGTLAALDIDQQDNIRIGSIYQTGNSRYSDIITLNKSGNVISQTNIGGNSAYRGVVIADISSSSNGISVSGSFLGTMKFDINGSEKLIYSPNQATYFPFALNLDLNDNVAWVANISSSSSSATGIISSIISDGISTYITGTAYSDVDFGNHLRTFGGTQSGFVASIDTNGNWNWINELSCSGTVESNSLALDSSGNIYVAGSQKSCTLVLASLSLPQLAGDEDVFIIRMNSSGVPDWAKSAGGGTKDELASLTLDSDDNIIVTGFQEGSGMYGAITTPSAGGTDLIIGKLSADFDNDGFPDKNDDDIDGDNLLNYEDLCVYSTILFLSTNSNDHDSDGCEDTLEDDDDDNDELNDTLDYCAKGMTNWIRDNSTDLDDDGCMDALEDYDDDNDGFEDYEDYCSRIPGNSTFEFEKGCPDADGDGRPDILDPFKDDPAEWSDMDGDGVGDNSDAFPSDATQQYDTDGDTYGDEEFGNAGDSCPTIFGNSTIDRYGCLDTDGDGWSDEGDDFPLDPTEYLDSDSDGYPDSSDDFPFDPTQWKDSDGDGYGDNPQGNLGDAYPNDASRYADSDRDGIDDQADAFPYDPTQWEDADGDGMGDNPMGIGADKFPNDPTQWGDIDGDGYGDNSTGNNPDAFPTDATQWSDMDGDGYGDNPTGRLYDLFPENPTQWEDADGDGLGDNQSGTDADPYLNDFDNDGYNDTIDILPRVASPGDLDNDKCLDGVDDFWDNPLECLDTDGDGIGNNADADDDNDEWTDADEIRANTDPLDPNSTPVDSFEIQIGNIGLGAWDLIGIFGGVPIFAWIAFGFVTRNARCARFEEDLENANSREELEQVALRWEYSLMLRLLGPHQGIRLERLRSELDDKFENAELLMAADGFEPMTDIEQAPIVESEQKDVPEIDAIPSSDTPADQTDEHGYSWLSYNGQNWYRTASDTKWTRHE